GGGPTSSGVGGGGGAGASGGAGAGASGGAGGASAGDSGSEGSCSCRVAGTTDAGTNQGALALVAGAFVATRIRRRLRASR
ncbi:MYXO-CTERM sorting domain-containing protein, partial [Polyangium sp. y55x31]|uniref:MYXO-CTERM sorting domain-containing protein n=1 Tax=Polyangium sp. y55x31 TaxID=3042688 RepID=UPI0024823679